MLRNGKILSAVCTLNEHLYSMVTSVSVYTYAALYVYTDVYLFVALK